MGEMRLYYSAISKFVDDCEVDYTEFYSDVETILAEVDKRLNDIEDDYQYISKQISKAEYLDNEVNTKILNFTYQRDLFLKNAEEHQRRIDYLYAHPKIVQTRDSDGNVTTTKEYDYAQIRREESLRDEANHKAEVFNGKISQANQLKQELNSLRDKCNNLKEAIKYMFELTEKCSYNISHYLRMIEDEKGYNIYSLNKVVSNVEEYLNTPRFIYVE